MVGLELREATFASSLVRRCCSVTPWPGQLNRRSVGRKGIVKEMKELIRWLIVLTIGFTCSTSVSVGQSDTEYQELPNFHHVNKNRYRGAQPRAGGFRTLARLGIKTVVNLRDDDARARAEDTEVQAAGLRYLNVPLDNLGRPADDKIERVLAIIEAPENQPVFVHCKRGADRTGTIVAIYRIEHDGWTSERAKAEADRYGMAVWQFGMKDYIHDYYKRRAIRKTVSMPVSLTDGRPNKSLDRSHGERVSHHRWSGAAVR